MLGWMGRLLGRSAARRGARAHPPGSDRPGPAEPTRFSEPPSAGQGSRSAPAQGAGAAPREPEAGDPFAPFALALGLEVPEPEPENADPDPEDALLAQRVLEHFRRNRPGPASAPSLSLQLLNLVASPRAEVGEMVRLISADAALSAGVLTVANSVAYRGLDEIETVRAAVVRLGLDEVARVAGAVGARTLFSPKLKAELAAHGRRHGALFHRALAVATAAGALALSRRNGRSDRAYLGGMLCDVGKSIALRSVAALGADPGAAPPDPARVERVLEMVHVEVGGECHQEWNLPRYLTVMAVRHHDREIPPDPEFVDLHAVRLCGALLDLRSGGPAARAARETVQSAAALGLGPPAVRAVDADIRAAAGRAAIAFGIELA
jgi:HD-like signal output (HDOD) protein